jgi:pimeloyl-ACP methyl ester carboxylesterase
MFKKLAVGIVALAVVASFVVFVLLQQSSTEHLPMDTEARTNASGHFVELSAGVTHYEIAGPESGQAVVLVHGFSVPSYIWDTTFEALANAGFRVVRFDLFGRGYSDRPDVAYNGDLFERQVTDLIAELGLQQPVDIIGLSMGGAVTMRVVANNPELIRKIVLVDPSHKASPAPQLPIFIGSKLLAITYIPTAAEGQLTDFVYPENYPDWVDQYRVQMQYEGFARAIISTIYNFGTEDHLANYRQVQEVGFPVKLIWGVEDQTLDVSGADTVQSVLDVDYMPVEDAGHLPHIEKASIVNAAIVEFLHGGPADEPET